MVAVQLGHNKKMTKKKSEKRKIDNMISAIERQCEHVQEDREFLKHCFESLDDDEDGLLTEKNLEMWLTVRLATCYLLLAKGQLVDLQLAPLRPPPRFHRIRPCRSIR